MRAIFITYDGLLDQLGQSQILPYLYAVSEGGKFYAVVSFEKQAAMQEGGAQLRNTLSSAGITWAPLGFTSGWGKLGKLWDLLKMYAVCMVLHLRHRFNVIHCRSYQAMQVGCLMSYCLGGRTIFDMRGLWVDERVDGGLWSQNHWINRFAYRTYKSIERRLLASACHVVALTEKVVPELKKLSPTMTAPVTVIPCCADFEHFVLPEIESRLAWRQSIGLPPQAKVIAYLGSLGTWYLLDQMLQFFKSAANGREDVHLLLITKDWRAEHEALLISMGLQGLRNRIHIRAATRREVPSLLGVADVMLSFIKPAYSKMASSPTKLAEAFAVGIPVISNTGVGDVESITRELDAGAVVDLELVGALEQLALDLDTVCAKGGVLLRAKARERFGLEIARQSYRQIYTSLDSTQ